MFGLSSDAHDDVTGSKSEGSSIGGKRETRGDQTGEVIAFVGEGVTFKGNIRYQGTIRIDGRFEGEIATDGVLIVGEKAVVTAKIEAGTISSQGRITGDINAKEKVKLMGSATFEGTVKTPSISIDEGVIFNGTCRMSKDGESKERSEDEVLERLEETLKVR